MHVLDIDDSFYTTVNDMEEKMSEEGKINFEDSVIFQIELLHEAEGICISYFKENAKKKQAIKEFFEKISKKSDNNIFCIGVGRSGLAVRTFAMRLTQMEYRRVYVAGETTTPAVKKDDIVVVISSSGETETVRNLVMKYKAYGAIVIALSAHKESTIGNVADLFRAHTGQEPDIDRQSGICSESKKFEKLSSTRNYIGKICD